MTVTPALPAAFRVVDLEQPVEDMNITLSDGRACRTLVGLVRRDGRLVTTLTIGLDSEGRVSAPALEAALARVPAEICNGSQSSLQTLRRPGLSVIVATCANAARTVRCVGALLACGYEDLDVIVVENRPARSRVEAALAAAFPSEERVRVIAVPRPGLSAARNAGIAQARGEIVAFIDDDVVVDGRWAHTVTRAFDDQSVACVTGLIMPLSLGTTAQALFDEFAGFGKGLQSRTFELGAEPRAPLFPYAAGAFGSGANTAIRTSIARAMGGFETKLGAGTAARGGEDLDLYVRLLLRGKRLVYEPSAIVFHEHPADSAGVRERAFGYGVGLTAMLTRQLVTGPRLRLLRAIPAGMRYALDPTSRKNASRSNSYPWTLTALERLGMAFGPVAYALSARAARRADQLARTAGSDDETFIPGAAGMVALDGPLGDLDLGCAPSGERYGSLLALVCLHGDTLATIDLPLQEGTIGGAELADRVWRATHEQIEAHVRSHGCLQPDDITPAALSQGLASATCPQRAVDRADAPFVTVIVPTAGRPERIATCLASLTAMSYPRFEILMVDNAPADGRTREIVEAWAATDDRVRYAAEPLPGSSVARNRGIRESSSALLAFTDDDVKVDPAWLSWMVEPFLADEQVGVVTGLVMPARLDTPEQRWFEQFSGFGKGLEPRHFDTGANHAADRLLFPYWGAAFGSGNSMAFRRQVLLEIGGFDPALGAGSPAKAGADIESFSHALIRGQRLAYEPRAVCWHDHRAHEAALRRQTFNYGVGCTAILTKWLLRDRRLRSLVAREVLRVPARRLATRGDAAAVPHEISRLNLQFAMNRSHGTLPRQLAGFALGPLLYVRSLLWARRLGLRDVLAAESS
jgi:GT2 family glycosyltransferase